MNTADRYRLTLESIQLGMLSGDLPTSAALRMIEAALGAPLTPVDEPASDVTREQLVDALRAVQHRPSPCPAVSSAMGALADLLTDLIDDPPAIDSTAPWATLVGPQQHPDPI